MNRGRISVLRHGTGVTDVRRGRVIELGARALLLVGEDGLDGAVKEAGEFEGEREAGIVFAGLDGVDGLAGDLEFLGEVGLRPVTFGA